MTPHGWHGWAQVSEASPVRADTIFRIASMTKSITAACLLMLRDGGRICLDDPVHAHVPELRSLVYPTADSAPLTVRNLLTMSAGFVGDDPWADRLLDMDGLAFSRSIGAGIPFDQPPGTDFEYSNFGYAILGRVIEAASGTTLPDLARARLFQPLGMADTTFKGDSVSCARRALGYRDSPAGWRAETALRHGSFGAMGGV